MRWLPWVVPATLLALVGLVAMRATRAAAPIETPMAHRTSVRDIGTETICDFSEHRDRVAGADRVALVVACAILLLGIRRLARRGVP